MKKKAQRKERLDKILIDTNKKYEELTDLKQGGNLDPVQHSTEPKVEEYDISTMIEHYENEARNILKDAGYPLTIRELLDRQAKGRLPRRIHEVKNVLVYFEMVRHYVEKNDISWALYSMAFGVQDAMKARMRPLEPDILRGRKILKAASEGGKSKKQASDLRHQIWQRDAKEIRKNGSTHSNQNVARILEKRYAGDPALKAKQDTIARIIKK